MKYGFDSEEYKLLKKEPKFIDPPINHLGIKQCENGSKWINNIPFEVVFVSPMLRTCMTTKFMFRNHPNKHSIKFIVLPIAKEGMHLCNDMMGDL